jgi:hypothetical protein
MITGSRILLGLLSLFLLFPMSLLRAEETAAQIDLANGADLSVIGATPGEPISTVTAGGLAGELRAIAADVNNDGADDLIIGVPTGDPKDPNDSTRVRSNAGVVYVIFGRQGMASPTIRDLETQPPDITIIGAEAGDQFGSALAIGNVNGDQFADILIGAPNADGPGNARPNVGETYIILGDQNLGRTSSRDMAAPTGSGTGPDVTIIGWGGNPNQAGQMDDGDQAGTSIAAADVNGDRVDDAIIGAPGLDGPNNNRDGGGAVYVFYGPLNRGTMRDAATALPQGYNMVIYGKARTVLGVQFPGTSLGRSVAAGDVNGDGRADIIAAGPQGSTTNERLFNGEIYVIFGVTDPTPPPIAKDTARAGVANLTMVGADGGDTVGASLAVGDVNGDGIDDIVVSSSTAFGPNNSRLLSGEVYVILGRSDLGGPAINLGTGANLTIYGAEAGDQLGFSLAVGEVNGSGPKEIIISAPGADGPNNSRDGAGEVYIVFGSPQLTSSRTKDLSQSPADTMIIGAQATNQIGFTVAIGDVDRDQRNDVILTSPFSNGQAANPKPNVGATYVIFRGGT